jgi:hypothetical protein
MSEVSTAMGVQILALCMATIKMEAAGSSVTLLTTYNITRYHKPEDHSLKCTEMHLIQPFEEEARLNNI